MRWPTCWLVLLLMGGACVADEQSELLEKAIKAHGGDKLTQAQRS